jgi:hypothetical protein
MARDRLKRRPDRYVNHIYGETEVGGTSWLYLTGRPVQEIGLLKLSETPPPKLTEAIQHGIFKYGIIPVAFYGLLAGIMWYNHRERPNGSPHAGAQGSAPSARAPEGGGR